MEIGPRELSVISPGFERSIFTYQRTINGKLFEFDVSRVNEAPDRPDPRGEIFSVWAYDVEDNPVHALTR